jgi:ankyrin repeat protein
LILSDYQLKVIPLLKYILPLYGEKTKEVINRPMGFRGTPFIEACQSRAANTELIEMLIDYGADTNITDRKGATALMILSQNGGHISSSVFKKMKNWNTQDNYGRNILHYFAVGDKKPNIEWMKLLLSSLRGPKAKLNLINQPDKQGRTPLMVAAR